MNTTRTKDKDVVGTASTASTPRTRLTVNIRKKLAKRRQRNGLGLYLRSAFAGRRRWRCCYPSPSPCPCPCLCVGNIPGQRGERLYGMKRRSCFISGTDRGCLEHRRDKVREFRDYVREVRWAGDNRCQPDSPCRCWNGDEVRVHHRVYSAGSHGLRQMGMGWDGLRRCSRRCRVGHGGSSRGIGLTSRLLRCLPTTIKEGLLGPKERDRSSGVGVAILSTEQRGLNDRYMIDRRYNR